MRAKRISTELVYIGITVVAAEKDSVTHARCIKCRCRQEDGRTRFECAARAKTFYRRSVMHVQVMIDCVTVEILEQVN